MIEPAGNGVALNTECHLWSPGWPWDPIHTCAVSLTLKWPTLANVLPVDSGKAIVLFFVVAVCDAMRASPASPLVEACFGARPNHPVENRNDPESLTSNLAGSLLRSQLLPWRAFTALSAIAVVLVKAATGKLVCILDACF